MLLRDLNTCIHACIRNPSMCYHTVVVVVLASRVGRLDVHDVKFLLCAKSGWAEHFKIETCLC
jgi:hypothetical protein